MLGMTLAELSVWIRSSSSAKSRRYAGILGKRVRGLTPEPLFEIFARSETRFLDSIFSRDLWVKIGSETCCSRVSQTETSQRFSLLNFVARLTSYESCRKKFRSKTCYAQVLQTNFVAILASLANRNFVVRLARIISNFNPGVLRESCENLARILCQTLISRYELWFGLFASLTNFTI
jgi:hypothetical protein